MSPPAYAGWIYFNVKEAYEHLLKHGFVYTFRNPGRKVGWGYAIHGKEFKKVFIKKVENEPEKYLQYSGFSTVNEWIKAAEAAHNTGINELAIFYVKILGDAA